MKVFAVLLVSLACFSSVIVGAASQIVVRFKSHPLDGEAICGGSVLTDKYILTAAHCLDYMEMDIMIQFNDTYTETLHPTFVIKHTLDDVGLLFLGLGFPKLNISSPSISLDVVKEGDVGTVLSLHSGYMESVNVTVMANNYCEQNIQNFSSWQFCTNKCFDNPGAGFEIDGRIAGIASWGVRGCPPGSPGVWTRVSGYSPWINGYVNNQYIR